MQRGLNSTVKSATVGRDRDFSAHSVTTQAHNQNLHVHTCQMQGETNMQAIYRNTKTDNFTILDNAIINAADLSALARMTLIYLLSKPSTWKVRATDIKRHLGVGINKVYRLLQELRDAGYIIMKRVQSAVHWFVYDVPQSSHEIAKGLAVTDHDGFHHDGKSDDLVKIENPVKIETSTTPHPKINPAPASMNVENVVVDEKGKESPPDPIPYIAPDQQKAARKVLSELSEDQAALVLSAFALALSRHNVSSKIGYLVGLVKAMKDGRFTAPEPKHAVPASNPYLNAQKSWAWRGGNGVYSQYGASGGVHIQNLADRLEKERVDSEEALKRGKLSNADHAAWLEREFGKSGSVSSLSARLAKFCN